MPEYNGCVITGDMVDLWSDLNFYKRKNKPRNRRVVAILGIFVGVVIGHAVAVRVRIFWNFVKLRD